MTTTLPTALTAEITNTCVCSYCPDCAVITQSADGKCEDCRTTLESHDCGANCYTESLEDFAENLLKPWVEANPSATGYVAEGTDLGWRNLSGRMLFDPDSEHHLPELVAPARTEWIQRWTCEPWLGGQLTAVQLHHDSPTGESIELRAATIAEAEEL